jgi:hypothetical protein
VEQSTKLCECGCSEPVSRATRTRRGRRKGEFVRFRTGHNGRSKVWSEGSPQPPNPSGVCQCGCGLPAPVATRSSSKIGHVKGEHVRFIRGHAGFLRTLIPEPCACGCGEMANPGRRFINHHQRVKEAAILPEDYVLTDCGYRTPCWLWIHARVKGYGVHNRGRGRLGTRAHRLAYVQFRGPIPTGMVLDHLCWQRACVNPWHLEIVSNAENSRRGQIARSQILASLPEGLRILPVPWTP